MRVLLAHAAIRALDCRRSLGENRVVSQALRRFFRMLPDAWSEPGGPASRPPGRGAAVSEPVTTLSAATGGDLRRDLSWREVWGPAGVGDKMRVRLTTGGMCWALLHLHRDGSSGHYGEEDIRFVADVAYLLAPRLRNDVRAPAPRNDDPVPEPGTIILDQEQSVVAATEQAWRWIDRLAITPPNPAEPLPGVYVLATKVAATGRPARVRVRAADGCWVAVQVAPLSTGSGIPAGYTATLEAASAEDMAPMLMRAWGLTSREREVARQVLDGLPTEDIAAALFISVHTVRDHLKAIFTKVGVSRRPDLIASLTGRTPA